MGRLPSKGTAVIDRLTPCRRRTLPGVFLAALATALLPSAVHAQESDSQLWGLFTFNARTPDGLRLYAEVQPRLGEDYGRISQLLVRPAVGYQVNRTFSVWLGYGWTPAFTPRYANEHRPFQQLLWEDRAGRADVVNRFRLEERFIDRAGGTSLRARHLLRGLYPLDRDRRWALVAWNELFWNLNDTDSGPQSGFDQNRTVLAGAYSIDRHTRVELGYQAVFVDPPGDRRSRRLDVLLLFVNYNL